MSFNSTMNPITNEEIMNLRYAKQHFQDCYLVSSISALAHSKKGSEILKNNIAHIDNGYKIKFNNINNTTKDFFITEEELNNLTPIDSYGNPIKKYHCLQNNPILRAIEVAMKKILIDNPEKNLGYVD